MRLAVIAGQDVELRRFYGQARRACQNFGRKLRDSHVIKRIRASKASI